MATRGIVVVPPFEIRGPELTVNGPIAPESLRQYLLYWDKIEWPSNNIIEIGGETPETEFLKHAGVLQRTRIQFASVSGNLGIALLLAQAAASYIPKQIRARMLVARTGRKHSYASQGSFRRGSHD